VPELHRRASAWYAENGEPSDAIRHALAGGDFPGAADLVESAAPALLRSRQEATVLAWLRALPDEVLHDRPVLSDAYAGVLLQTGQIEGVEARLRDAERWLDAAGTHPSQEVPPGRMVVASDAGLRRLAASVAMHRATQALVLGDVEQTVAHARRALERAPTTTTSCAEEAPR
jgi:LuxR family maltose regulon positive regulatory protein